MPGRSANTEEITQNDQPLIALKKDNSKVLNPLGPSIKIVVSCIEFQLRKLDQTETLLTVEAKEILTKLAEALAKHETGTPCILAWDLAEARKILSRVLNSKYTLQQIAPRLRTLWELGDALYSLAPALVALRAVKSQLCPCSLKQKMN